MAKYVVSTPTGYLSKDGEGTTLDVDKAKLNQAEVEVKTEGLRRYTIIKIDD